MSRRRASPPLSVARNRQALSPGMESLTSAGRDGRYCSDRERTPWALWGFANGAQGTRGRGGESYLRMTLKIGLATRSATGSDQDI
jgi:hypothetical protein